MNRYLVQGIVADIRAGKRVGFISAQRWDSRDLVGQVLSQVSPEELDGVYRTNGTESVRLGNGGTLHVIPDPVTARDAAVSVLVVLDWDDLTDTARAHLFTAARNAELIKL